MTHGRGCCQDAASVEVGESIELTGNSRPNNIDLEQRVLNCTTPDEIGEFWDTHSLADYWDETHQVEFQVNFGRQSDFRSYPGESLCGVVE